MAKSSTQVNKFDRMTDVAHDIHQHLQDIPEYISGCVHFRPTANGVTMVGLLPDRPQRGKGGYKAEGLKSAFTVEFPEYCVNIGQGRPTAEKRLQSFVIGDAYRHQRLMQAMQSRLPDSEDTSLYFVTDEISVTHDDNKVVCDILAINRRKDGVAPVLMELKSERAMSRLVEQLNNYEAIMKTYQTNFEGLFSALMGEEIRFAFPPEKWMVWPASDTGPDRREAELLPQGIRIVGYSESDAGFDFHIGQCPDWN